MYLRYSQILTGTFGSKARDSFPLRGANRNPDAPSCLIVEKALWSQNSSPLSIFVVLGRICVLKVEKETSDLAKHFSPFKTQIGPKIKKIAGDYFSASLLTAKQVRSSVTKTGVPLPVCMNWCGANLEQFFPPCECEAERQGVREGVEGVLS